ncbi:MAG TPA: adenine deaminase, partial [bacterium]|nr:adenine deaminase [bacterium]
MDRWSIDVTRELIKAARGDQRVDLLIRNARLINVFSGEIYKEDVAVHKGVVVGFGNYKAEKILDLKGKYLAPGFIESHIHLESSLLSVTEFSRAVVSRGTTTVVADPHEVANVLGLDGMKYMLESSKYQPITLYFTLPSAVPASLSLETSGAHLTGEDLKPLFSQKWVVGLGEVMNYPDVISLSKDTLNKLEMADDKTIEGHAPGLTGKNLSAYLVSGIRSDHESFLLEEAREKLRKGMVIMIREGSIAHNLKTLIPLVNKNNSFRFILVSDDRHPIELYEKGHLDYTLREAIKQGVPALDAIRMVTINPSLYFNLKNIGAIAPGYWADMVVLSDLAKLRIEKVFKKGKEVFSDGRFLWKERPKKVFVRSSINIKWLEQKDLIFPAAARKARVIRIVPGELITEEEIHTVKTDGRFVMSDTSRDILKLLVIERHRASGNIGKGLVRGIGLKKGAIAQSIAHDTHNIIACGVDDESIFTAVSEIVRMGGGIAAAYRSRVTAKLPLPIAGLMTDMKLEKVVKKFNSLLEAAKELGSKLEDPYMNLSFLALPV